MHKNDGLYHWCGKCGAILNNQPGFDPDSPLGTCSVCGAGWYNENIYQGERFKGVFWHCDRCDALLNIQKGFSDLNDYWKCTICSNVNHIAESEIDDYTKQFEVDNEELINRNCENSQKSKAPNELFRFCTYCGYKTSIDSCFCPNCGRSIKKKTDSVQENTNKNECFVNTSADNQQYEHIRKETYDGEIRKCPNCGEILNSFTPNCPTCGYELRNSKTSNYILEFSKKLESAYSSKQKDDLIRHFVMPNTKEDIYEFMILAATNLEAGGDNTDAWLIKLEQAHQKAKYMFGDSPDIKYIDDIYYTATNNYKKIKRSDKANSIGQFISKHWFGILLIVLGTLSFILIILGAIFHIGVVTWDEAETTGHLWWKKEEIKSHSLQVLTIIGGILAYITVMTAMIGKSKHNKTESDDSEDDEE